MSTQAKEPSGFNFQNLDFPLHRFQEEAWFALEDPSIREIALQAGIQGGKTSFGALATAKMIGVLSLAHPGCNFIVAADTYKTLSQATVPTLIKLLGRNVGRYNQGKQEFQIMTGGKVYFRTSTDPYSVEGIPDCAWAWIDEAGKCSKLFQVNVLGRVARLKGKTLYTSTPYAMNWLYKDVEKPALNGERADIKFIRFASSDNPAFPQDEFERQKRILDPRTFRRKYMGIHERMEGLVYELTDDNFCDPHKLPEGTRFFAGLDFGFTEGHEFALTVRAVTLDGFHYAIDAFKQTGLEPSKQVMVCRAKRQTYGIEMFYCDPARPDMISELNRAGISAIGFHQGKESYKQIVPGITRHQELVRSGRYKIFRDTCAYLEDEYETYHWPEMNEDKPAKELPVKLNDDLMDAERYVSVGTMHVKIKETRLSPLSQRTVHIDTFNPKKRSKKAGNWNTF